jgi:hypothetical protein
MNTGLMKDASAETEKAWAAFHAIVDGGLFYEVVMVLNRAPVDDKFANGDEYHGVPVDAEPLYELDARSLHGYKPKGEEGLAGLTAKTAGELHHPVASGILLDAYDNERTPHDGEDAKPGQFYGKYAAIVPRGYGAMIAGIFRPRFRVANPKNAGTKDAWIRIHTGQAQGLEWITALRASQGLEPLPAPRIATKDEL